RLDWAGDIFTDYVMSRDPAQFRRLPWRNQFELALSVPFQRIKRGLLAKVHTPGRQKAAGKSSLYDPELIDAFGDLSRHPQTRSATAPEPRFAPSDLARGFNKSMHGAAGIRRFCRWARTHGVSVLATYPNLAYQAAYESPQAQETIACIEELYRTESV